VIERTLVNTTSRTTVLARMYRLMRTGAGRSRTARPVALAAFAFFAFASSLSPALAVLSQQPLFAVASAPPSLILDPARRAAGTAPGLSGSTVSAGNMFIESGFFVESWEGYLHAYDQVARLESLLGGGADPAPLWTANFPPPDRRNIFTSTALSTVVAFTWSTLADGQKTSLDATSLGASSSPVLDYLRGESANEQRNGGPYRSRFNTVLGDIVNSSPLYSVAADHAYQLQPAGSFTVPAGAPQGHARYRDYVAKKKSTRLPIVVVGANGGMLHVFDARPAALTSGREMLAYVPRSLYPSLAELTSPAYEHRYYVDGQVVEGDVWDGSQWRTFAVGSTGAGPAGLFAIDITSPESGLGVATIKWDVVPSEHPDAGVVGHLGNTLHAGVIGSVKDGTATNGRGRWVYITGNGYESEHRTAALLVFDVFTGALIKAIDTGRGSAAEPNGIGGITPVYDGNRNIVLVYGGDRHGNLWKFDFSGAPSDPDGAGPLKGWGVHNIAAGTAEPLFRATDDTGTGQPIVAAPRITPHPLGGLYVGFGTGKLFEPTDPYDTQVQSIYLLRDLGTLAPVAKTDLQRINLQEYAHDHDGDVATPPLTYRRLKAGDAANYRTSGQGFFLPLVAEGRAPEGERVLAAPVLDAGVLSFTTFVPASQTDAGMSSSASYLYRLNLVGSLTDTGFAAASGNAVVGQRIQPGLVSGAVSLFEASAPSGTRIDSMSAAQVRSMLLSPKYRLVDGRAVPQGATSTCAQVGLRIDGAAVRIPTVCSGLLPLRSWRPLR
jgi:type IV pilus assembly protein PilY1